MSNPKPFQLIAAILWLSALGAFVVGFSVPGLEVLRYLAIADAVVASGFTWAALRKVK